MSFAAVAIGSTVAGVAGTVGSTIAAGNAAGKQADAAKYAADLQQQQYNQTRQDQQPWRQGGLQAMYGPGGLFTRLPSSGASGNSGGNLQTDWTKNRLQALKDERQGKSDNINLGNQAKTDAARRQFWSQSDQSDATLEKQAASDWGTMGVKETAGQVDPSLYQLDPSLTKSFSMDDFQQDPGYQFRMQQGQDAIERSAAARGGLQSGGTLKAITDYGQNFASNEYSNAYNRFTNNQNNRYNKLASLAGIGQTATNQVDNAGANYANNVGNITTSNANAQGAAGIAQANAIGSGLSGIGKTWMDYSMMNKLFPSAGGGGGTLSGMSTSVPGYGAMVPA